MTSNKIYSLNLKNLILKHKDVELDWTELILENDGSFSRDCQYMAFDCDGIEVVVDFDIDVHGRVDHDPGDYWTAPYTDVDITDVNVSVTNLNIDEYDVELTDSLISFFEGEIKKHMM